MVYSCICCFREARVAKVLFCHKQGRNTSVGGLRTSWAVPPFIVSLYAYALSVLCRFAFCALCDLMWRLSKFSDFVIGATFC